MENINTEKIPENVPAINIKDDNGQQLISARELHRKLNVTTRFSKWVEQNFGDFIQDEDFTSVTAVTLVSRVLFALKSLIFKSDPGVRFTLKSPSATIK